MWAWVGCILMMSVGVGCIGIPLHNGPRCMTISASYEPIKYEAKFPMIPEKREGENFKVTLMDFKSKEVETEEFFQEGQICRRSRQFSIDQLFYVCFELMIQRQLPKGTEIYVQYSTTEDFEELIGKVNIPTELQGKENLRAIFSRSEEIQRVNKATIESQNRERKLQDQIVNVNLHRSKRIISLTLIECMVIVFSGIYQVFALRKFLIEKNLY